jgi:PEP-CTERM motif
MTRTATLGLILVLFASAPASAQLPWSYYVRFDAADGAHNILLGSDVSPDPDGGTPVSVVYTTGGFGPSHIDITTPVGTTDLFAFGHGNWDIVETPPSNTVANRYVLNFGFTPHGSGATVSGQMEGTISASGVFTTGTGNFNLSVDHRPIDLGGLVLVQFGTRQSESQSVITMTVAPSIDGPVAETPEPTTLALAGIGLVGVVGMRMRRRAGS